MISGMAQMAASQFVEQGAVLAVERHGNVGGAGYAGYSRIENGAVADDKAAFFEQRVRLKRAQAERWIRSASPAWSVWYCLARRSGSHDPSRRGAWAEFPAFNRANGKVLCCFSPIIC